MIFDIFHSVGRVDSLAHPYSDRQVFIEFFRQVELAEQLGFGTIWVAESHFSSEVQKQNTYPVIPNYQGEVGLNTDSFQLASWIQSRTKKIGFGTAITNIVGGNGGPIATADRVRMLAWSNCNLRETSRPIAIGVASGRFPYINRPFGVVPKDEFEAYFWQVIQKYIFLEALEIFLRLSRGETLSSQDVTEHWMPMSHFSGVGEAEIFQKFDIKKLGHCWDKNQGIRYKPRWGFESLSLVPKFEDHKQLEKLRFVLGSHEPRARELGLKYADLDIFNLSFTPPKEIEKTHEDMKNLINLYATNRSSNVTYRPWHRSRMPRTVLVFIDQDSKKAWQRAERAIAIYRDAMKGTVQLPSTEELLARALVGSPGEILDQLHPDDAHGFHKEDRLMLWFEFNQSDGNAIMDQMRLFAEKVIPCC